MSIVLDRTQAPSVKTLDQFNIQKANSVQLSNGLQLHTIHSGDQPVIKIEWYFKAGSWYESKPLVAVATNKLLKEGTQKQSSHEFATQIDFYGSILSAGFNDDFGYVSLYCLTKHLKELLPLISEMIQEPKFDKKELEIFLHKRANKLKVNNSKNEYVAKNLLDKAIFGQDHPYGYYPTKTDYLNVTTDDCKVFHEKYYRLANCHVIASGLIPDDFTSLIEKHFGVQKGDRPEEVRHKINVPHQSKIIHSIPFSHQAGIAMGQRSIAKKHEDFSALIVANTIFGGYFGSRLMSNIREDKGYTYGIYSSLVPNIKDSYMMITTEVGKNVWQPAYKEIKFEMERLLQDKVKDDELELVKNYLLGNFLSSIDGPFALSNRLKGTLFHGLDYTYYDTFVNTVKYISSSQLQDIYQKYYKLEDFTQVAVI